MCVSKYVLLWRAERHLPNLGLSGWESAKVDSEYSEDVLVTFDVSFQSLRSVLFQSLRSVPVLVTTFPYTTSNIPLMLCLPLW